MGGRQTSPHYVELTKWMTEEFRKSGALKVTEVFDYLRKAYPGENIVLDRFGQEQLSDEAHARFAAVVHEATWVPSRREWRPRRWWSRSLDVAEMHRRKQRMGVFLGHLQQLEERQTQEVPTDESEREFRLDDIRTSFHHITTNILDVAADAAEVGVPVEPDRATSHITLTRARVSMAMSRYSWLIKGERKPRSVRMPMPGEGSRPTFARWFRGLHNRDYAVMAALGPIAFAIAVWFIELYAQYRIEQATKTSTPQAAAISAATPHDISRSPSIAALPSSRPVPSATSAQQFAPRVGDDASAADAARAP